MSAPINPRTSLQHSYSPCDKHALVQANLVKGIALDSFSRLIIGSSVEEHQRPHGLARGVALVYSGVKKGTDTGAPPSQKEFIRTVIRRKWGGGAKMCPEDAIDRVLLVVCIQFNAIAANQPSAYL